MKTPHVVNSINTVPIKLQELCFLLNLNNGHHRYEGKKYPVLYLTVRVLCRAGTHVKPNVYAYVIVHTHLCCAAALWANVSVP